MESFRRKRWKNKINISNSNKKTIKLYVADGYNNAVYLIDKQCTTLYSSNKGTAKNLKIEDIEEKIDKNKFDYMQYVDGQGRPKYGNTEEYSSNLYYPKIYENEIGCKAISNSDNIGNTLGLSLQTREQLTTGNLIATNRLKGTQTYWARKMNSSDFIDLKYYNIFIKYSSDFYPIYWLSSRCVNCNSGYIGYFLRIVGGEWVGRDNIYYSYNQGHESIYAFRPVVSLNSNVQLSGDSINGWTIQ